MVKLLKTIINLCCPPTLSFWLLSLTTQYGHGEHGHLHTRYQLEVLNLHQRLKARKLIVSFCTKHYGDSEKLLYVSQGNQQDFWCSFKDEENSTPGRNGMWGNYSKKYDLHSAFIPGKYCSGSELKYSSKCANTIRKDRSTPCPVQTVPLHSHWRAASELS